MDSPTPAALRDLSRAGDVIEDYRPLCHGLDWSLGQEFWDVRGAGAFFGDDVPFKVTSDGNLARKAAHLLFTALDEADAVGSLEPRIQIMEFGAGSGLFARYLLDAFCRRCRERGRDYHERLTCFIADGAPRMLEQLREHRVLEAHEGRCRLVLADASRPETWPALEAPGFRAVFLNYVLDCLPAAIVRQRDGAWEQVHVRTLLARNSGWRDRTRLSLDEIRAAAASPTTGHRSELVRLRRLFAFDLSYRPVVSPEEMPHLDTAARCITGENGGAVLHNHGAIDCLERLRERLVPGGFVLVNDYADAPFDAAQGTFLPQRFGGSSAIGLNLGLLATRFSGRADCAWLAPEEGCVDLASRLLARDPGPATVAAFRERFSAAAYLEHFRSIEDARAQVKAKRHEAALTAFARALEAQPDNWVLLTEIASHLAYTTKDYAAALQAIDQAVTYNAWWAEAWNIRGDCLYYLDRFDEAHASFERALAACPDDVSARYNLTFTLMRKGDAAGAMIRIAEALALDSAGHQRERLLDKLRDILAELDTRRRAEQQLARDRYRPPL